MDFAFGDSASVQLLVFIAASVILALIPVYAICRLLNIGNPAWWAILFAVVAALALHDLAFTYIEDVQIAALASLALGAFAFSLLLDTSYVKGFAVGAVVLMITYAASQNLLDEQPPMEVLQERIAATQAELWPDYY